MRKAFGTTVHQYRCRASSARAGPRRHRAGRRLRLGDRCHRHVVARRQPGPARLGEGRSAVSAPGVTPADGTDPAPCSEYWGQKTARRRPVGYVNSAVPFEQCSFQPSQLRKAYGITGSGLTGKGASIAIVDAFGSSTMESDANRFATAHGDKAFTPGQYTEDVTP